MLLAANNGSRQSNNKDQTAKWQRSTNPRTPSKTPGKMTTLVVCKTKKMRNMQTHHDNRWITNSSRRCATRDQSKERLSRDNPLPTPLPCANVECSSLQPHSTEPLRSRFRKHQHAMLCLRTAHAASGCSTRIWLSVVVHCTCVA
jgi:hypothetical protein